MPGHGRGGVNRSTERGRVMLNRYSGLKFLTGAIAAVALSAMPALAADLPYKAPPPEPFVLDIHGFGDVTFTNDYITPRGLLVTNTGLTTQILNGLVFNLYKGPGLISNASLTVGIWNDLWSEQDNPKVGSWNEFDWFVGLNFTIAKNWNAGVLFIQFLSPPGNFRAESNIEFSLAYNDSNHGWPIALHPYVKLFYAAAGDSTVVEGRKG